MSYFKSSRKEESRNKGDSCGIRLMLENGHKFSHWEVGSNSPPLGLMLAFQDRHQQAVQDGAE